MINKEIQNIVDKLNNHGYIKTQDYLTLHQYKKTVQQNYLNNVTKTNYRQLQYLENVHLTHKNHINITKIQDLVDYLLLTKPTHALLLFNELVEKINAYYEITTEKPSMKIAKGWNKSLNTNNSKTYLYACIRNHLQKHNASFTHYELKTICGLEDN